MSTGPGGRSRRLAYDRRILLLALGTGLPGSALALWLLARSDLGTPLGVTLAALVVCSWLGCAFALRRKVVRPLQTLSNLLSALREGDFSIRARQTDLDGALEHAMIEINALAQILQQQRLGAVEATHLLGKVMAEVDVALLAFDPAGRLQFANREAERLLGAPEQELLDRSARQLGLGDCLRGPRARILDLDLPGGAGRYEIRRGSFRQGGEPRQLVVLSDLTRALRQQERQAWQRLVQVLRHEINNSLAPIKSLTDSLGVLLRRRPRPPDWQEDMETGLRVIGDRAAALGRFMSSYARLTQLPPPEPEPVDVREWVERVAALEKRIHVRVEGGPDARVRADGDQLEQLLINLLSNAVEASLDSGGDVCVRWHKRDGTTPQLELEVLDEGPGLPRTRNLFVPFFTTKPAGSGIGLVLSRQIAEAHGGSLTLENRRDARGCRARLRLPLES